MATIPRFGLTHYERRTISRVKIFEPALVDHGGRSVRAHILDVSAHGALMHTQSPPPNGSTAVLRIEGQRIWGKVVWVENSHFGLGFLGPVQAELVDRLSAPKPPKQSSVPEI